MPTILSFLLVLLPLTSHAATDEIETVAPPTIEDEVIGEFLRLTSATTNEARWAPLHERLYDKLFIAVRNEPRRATTKNLFPRRETIQERVEKLADALVEVLDANDRTLKPEARRERAVGILADLTLALARNSGGKASLAEPAILTGITLVGAGLGMYAQHVSPAAEILGGAGLLTGGLLGFVLSHPHSYAEKMNVATEMGRAFWDHVGLRWMGYVPPADADRGDPNVISRAVFERLKIDDENMAEACEAYLRDFKPPNLVLIK